MRETLKAEYSSDKTPLVIGSIEIPCYVLNDGTRVLSRNGMQKAIGYEGSSGDWLTNFVGAKNISKHISPSILAGLNEVIVFQRNDAGGSAPMTYGYEATKLIDFCDALIDLKKAGVLKPNQIGYAEQAEIIIRSVAKVGIIALIDEATGYQNDVNRAKDELQQILSKLLLSEQAKWIKTFPDEFFEMIFKMKGWDWKKASKKPQVIGYYINDFVYSRIAPALLGELRKLNPKSEETKTRKTKHHQWLTPDLGHPKLKEHLSGVMALGRASGFDWINFLHMMDRSYPKFGHTMQLLFPENPKGTLSPPKQSSGDKDFDLNINKAIKKGKLTK